MVCLLSNLAGSVENTGVELWNPPPYTFKNAYTMQLNVLLNRITTALATAMRPPPPPLQDYQQERPTEEQGEQSHGFGLVLKIFM